MQALLDVILPVFLVIGAGYVAVWKGYFSEVGVDALMKFTQGVAIPCLLFQALAKLDLRVSFDVPLLVSYYTGSLGCFVLGFAGARVIFKRSLPDCVSIGFCALFSNTILLGLPITERAYGPEALAGNYAIIALHAPFGYLLGISLMEIQKGSGQGPVATMRNVSSAILHNALIVGIGLGLAVNLLGVPVPGVVDDAVALLARAGLPAALFGLGGVLVRYRPEGDAKVIAMVCGISLLVHPLISFSLGSALALDRDAFRSVVVTAAMAPGVNAYIFANMYGAARRVAASAVLLSTATSILTVWVWLLLIP